MSDPSDRHAADSSGESASSDDARDRELPSAWAEFRPLALAILASAALHLAAYGVGYWISTFDVDIGADVEWLSSSDRLTGLGHRTKDRFADLGDVSEEEDEKEEPEPVDPETEERLERALKGDYEPPEPPEPETERETSATTEPSDERETSEESKSERPSRDSAEDEESRAFDDVAEHDALDRAGPNNLPDMRSFAPGNARMTALVRVDRIRGRPYEDAVRKILRAVPDYRLLLGVPAFDPIRDMDWFFMASPNPRYIQHTFLAVQHRLSKRRVRELVDRRFPDAPSWTVHEGYPIRDLVPASAEYRDPRKIVLADEGLALVAKERLLPKIVEPLSRDSRLLARASDEEHSRRGEEASAPSERATLLDGLAKIHRVARREKTVLLLSARGLVFVMPGVGRLPRFESVRMKVSHPEQPTLNIDLQFENRQKAKRFAGKCPAMRKAIDDAIPLSGMIGLSELLRRLDCRAEGDYVNVHAEFTEREVADLAELAYPFIPRPPALEDLPEPPSPPNNRSDAGGTGPDAGSAPSSVGSGDVSGGSGGRPDSDPRK